MSKITALIEDNGVSVERAMTKGDDVIVVTSKSNESKMQAIVRAIERLSAVDRLGALVRIER